MRKSNLLSHHLPRLLDIHQTLRVSLGNYARTIKEIKWKFIDTGDSLQLSYGVNTATLEHWQGDTILARWNLKGLLDDSLVTSDADGKSLTVVNDRAEYKRLGNADLSRITDKLYEPHRNDPRQF